MYEHEKFTFTALLPKEKNIFNLINGKIGVPQNIYTKDNKLFHRTFHFQRFCGQLYNLLLGFTAKVSARVPDTPRQ